MPKRLPYVLFTADWSRLPALEGFRQLNQGKLKKLGGTGFQPVQAFECTQRNLPHWQIPGSVYFITWRWVKGKTLGPEERTVTLNAIRHWRTIKWHPYAAVVMPDHVHALAQPLN
ncbi:MAG: hypothetical protein ACLP7A_02825 [Desulfobaccales bacterium]